MITEILITLTLAGQFSLADSGASTSSAAQETRVEPRDVNAIRRDVSALLRAESAAKSDAERAGHVRRMAEVYLEVVTDDRLISSPTLQQQKIKVWTRLTRVRDELKRRQTSDQRRGNSGDDGSQGERQLAELMATHLQLASQAVGGSSAVFAAAGGGAIADDFGDELVDLITNVIQPSHWNVNGGPGSIAYYRPAMALVVRASSEVQGNVGGVVGALRAAGE